MPGLDLLHQHTEDRLKGLDKEQRKNIYNFEVPVTFPCFLMQALRCLFLYITRMFDRVLKMNCLSLTSLHYVFVISDTTVI